MDRCNRAPAAGGGRADELTAGWLVGDPRLDEPAFICGNDCLHPKDTGYQKVVGAFLGVLTG